MKNHHDKKKKDQKKSKRKVKEKTKDSGREEILLKILLNVIAKFLLFFFLSGNVTTEIVAFLKWFYDRKYKYNASSERKSGVSLKLTSLTDSGERKE